MWLGYSAEHGVFEFVANGCAVYFFGQYASCGGVVVVGYEFVVVVVVVFLDVVHFLVYPFLGDYLVDGADNPAFGAVAVFIGVAEVVVHELAKGFVFYVVPFFGYGVVGHAVEWEDVDGESAYVVEVAAQYVGGVGVLYSGKGVGVFFVFVAAD